MGFCQLFSGSWESTAAAIRIIFLEITASGPLGEDQPRVIATVLGGSVGGGFLAHDAEEFTSDELRVVGFNRDPSHAEAVSADAGTAVALNKRHLVGPRPATEVAPEVLGIHV